MLRIWVCGHCGVQTNFPPTLLVLAVSVVIDIHNTKEPGNILVFLPGEEEIMTVCGLVRKKAANLRVFPRHSTLPPEEQKLAINWKGPERKCIVSTNIAETSLTIDNVAYAVDSGLSTPQD